MVQRESLPAGAHDRQDPVGQAVVLLLSIGASAERAFASAAPCVLFHRDAERAPTMAAFLTATCALKISPHCIMPNSNIDSSGSVNAISRTVAPRELNSLMRMLTSIQLLVLPEQASDLS